MKIYTFLIVALILWSCQTSTNADQDIQVSTGLHEMKEEPGIIPMDAGIQDIMLDDQSTFRTYDQYYRTLDDRFEGEHFLDNLKWMTIEHMVRFSNFKDADDATKRYYLGEIISRPFINHPAVMVEILNVTESITEKEKAYYAFRLITINREHLAGNPEYRDSHHELHKESYAQLHQVAFTRWGEPRHELVNY